MPHPVEAANEIIRKRDKKAPFNYFILRHSCVWLILSGETYIPVLENSYVES
jgi:hypothetical protein